MLSFLFLRRIQFDYLKSSEARKIVGAVHPAVLHSQVSLADASEVAAVILTSPEVHAGRTYHITCPAFSYAQVDGRVLGCIDEGY